MKNKWYTKTKRIPALDWDWFENSVKKYEIEGMKFDDYHEISHVLFHNGIEVVLEFVPPWTFITNGLKCKGFFRILINDEFGDNIEEWGGYETLKDFEEFIFSTTFRQGLKENYVVRFVRGKD